MAFTSITMLLLTLPLLYFLHALVSLGRNYLSVRRSHLPVLVNPTSFNSFIWLLGSKALTSLFQPLPAKLSSWVNRIDVGWTQHYRFSLYAQLHSRAFWLVNPSGKGLYIADPAAVEEVLRRCRVDFPKDPDFYMLFDVFGPNVDSSNGKVWEHHRRVTVPPFNEKISETVWNESGIQADGARRKWMRESEGGVVRSTLDDSTRVAFNVLTTAGFGLSYDFEDSGDGSSTRDWKIDGFIFSYRDALGLILGNMGLLLLHQILFRVGWPMRATWGLLKKLSVAKGEYRAYMQELLLRTEREKTLGGESPNENLMSVLVRSSEQGTDGASYGKGRPLLSEDEVFGNLFIYNLAGHDTTASVINFAVTILAMEPQWQEWIAQEVDSIVSEQPSLKYGTVFPRLQRCLAVMYETLRLYGPGPLVPRWTATSWQRLTIDGKDVLIPPYTAVQLDLVGLHHDPRAWPGPLEFRPDRWVLSTEQQGDSERVDSQGPYDWQSKSLMTPKAGTFVPWTGGPRVCPGKKFSQVEFSRVMLGLFGEGGRVRLVEENGESPEDAKARTRKLVDQSRAEFSLKVQNSDKIALKWYVKA